MYFSFAHITLSIKLTQTSSYNYYYLSIPEIISSLHRFIAIHFTLIISGVSTKKSYFLLAFSSFDFYYLIFPLPFFQKFLYFPIIGVDFIDSNLFNPLKIAVNLF